jgi:peptide/nickel transport system permease protein
MWAYTVRRILLIIPTMFIITVTVFTLMRIVPGDVIDLIMVQMEEEQMGEDVEINREAIEKALGLDKPIHTQYIKWVSGIFLRLDFGESLLSGKNVTDMIAERLPVTLELSIMTQALSLVLSIPLGIYSGVRQDSLIDYGGRTLAIALMSIPNFWIATLIIVYPSVYLGWSIQMEYVHIWDDFWKNQQILMIPALMGGITHIGGGMRLLRNVMLEVLRQDYVRTAWAKGVKERVIIFKHALRNAALPLVTMYGMMVPMLMGGSVIVENIFCIPGMGRLSLSALTQRDYPIISALNTIMASVVVVSFLVVDLSYAWLDPRVQYE